MGYCEVQRKADDWLAMARGIGSGRKMDVLMESEMPAGEGNGGGV
jgi:hypothetical protein